MSQELVAIVVLKRLTLVRRHEVMNILWQISRARGKRCARQLAMSLRQIGDATMFRRNCTSTR